MAIERRALRSAVRVETREGQPPVISGYAAVYYDPADPGTEFRLWEDLVERIMPGAFDRAAREDDVRLLVNHDPNLILGRTKSRTLRLAVDAKGLRYEGDVPDTQVGRDTVTSLKRGDLDGSSFGFSVTDEDIRREVRDGKELWIREIRGVNLYDVSPVTFPAYEATTSEARSADGVAALRAKVEALRATPAPAGALAGRLAGYAARARVVRLET